jgi:dipeptidyl aminopeptidase/acylaminoacyl peptidase
MTHKADLPCLPRTLFGTGILILGLSLTACTHTTPEAPRKTAELIPRQVFFENASRMSPDISPDGKWLAFLAPHEGVLNVFVAPVDRPDEAKVVTQDKLRGIRSYTWSNSSEFLLYLQDEAGNENFHIYATDPKTRQTRDLTPLKDVAAGIEGLSVRFPHEILVSLNDRDPQYHDVYRIDIRTGQRRLVLKNDQKFSSFTADHDLNIRAASRPLPDGGMELLVREAKGTWRVLEKVPMEDVLNTQIWATDKSGTVLYVADSRSRDTSAAFSLDLKAGRRSILAEDARADVGAFLMHPTEHRIQAVSFNYQRPEWKILDPSIEADFAALRQVQKGDIEIISRTLDDKTWIVAYDVDDGPVRYHRYDRPSKKTHYLFSSRPSLENLALAPMHPLIITSRDGLPLVSYLTLPVSADQNRDGKPEKPVPLVLLVHGGPWARDSWGYDGTQQWLASRGYAVLTVNYRSSTGFGKKFLNAGNREWAGKMHDDLLDAVEYAVTQGIAPRDRIAIMGGSYGGYASLVGLTFTPDVFACGVAIVGPSSLETLLNTIPPYWVPMIEQLTQRIGDHRTPEGREFLASRSPLFKAAAIKKPLLIGQGANDPRVKQSESDQIVQAMQKSNIPVTYVLYPDEGHGFARPENRLSFNAVTEVFLSSCLKGPFEPLGDDLKGSSIQVPAGASQIPGLEAALQSIKP